MLRFKQFSGSGPQLETAVNAWLSNYEPDVQQMVQTVGGDGTLSVCFLFEESFRGQERRLTEERGQPDRQAVPEAAEPEWRINPTEVP